VPRNFVSHWTQKCANLPLYLIHKNNTGCYFQISYFNLVVFVVPAAAVVLIVVALVVDIPVIIIIIIIIAVGW
jgi:hypothetical protein